MLLQLPGHNAVRTLLHNPHYRVNSVAWRPEASTFSAMLAAGSADGGVCVWDVPSGSAALRASASAHPRGGARSPSEAVAGVGWLGPGQVLGLTAGGRLSAWTLPSDAGSAVPTPQSPASPGQNLAIPSWTHELPASAGKPEAHWEGLAVDPGDRRRCVAWNAEGVFVVLSVRHAAGGGARVQQTSYQMSLAAGDRMAARFASSPDVLFLLLGRELIAFDLGLGCPAASTPLPARLGPARAIVRAVKARDFVGLRAEHDSSDESDSESELSSPLPDADADSALLPPPAQDEEGMDALLISHASGSVSVWRRQPQSLAYALVSSWSLFPPLLLPSPDDPKPALLALAAVAGGLWSAGGTRLVGLTSASVCAWRLPLLGACESWAAAPPPPPALKRALQLLPGPVTAMAASALPGAAGDASVGLLVVGTATGHLALIAVRASATPASLAMEVSLVLKVHASPVLGVRWLDPGRRAVSFSLEPAADRSEARGSVQITDLAMRLSWDLRGRRPGTPATTPPTRDAGPLLGLRASRRGRYVLLLFRGQPSEIWSVADGRPGVRLRQVDLPFVAVDWVDAPGSLDPASRPEGGQRPGSRPSGAFSSGTPGSLDARWPGAGSAGREPHPQSWPGSNASRLSQECPWSPGSETPSAEPSGAVPEAEERLAFALPDGRTGLLLVRGRRVLDAGPVAPQWEALVEGEVGVCALGAAGASVLLGDDRGGVALWEPHTGRCPSFDPGTGRVHRLVAWAAADDGGGAALVLGRGGRLALAELESGRSGWELRRLHRVQDALPHLGPVSDADWLGLPDPRGSGRPGALVALLDGGGIALLGLGPWEETRAQGTFFSQRNTSTPQTPSLSSSSDDLLGPRPSRCAALLPRAQAAALRGLLQGGARASDLARAGSGESSDALEEVLRRSIVPGAAPDSDERRPLCAALRAAARLRGLPRVLLAREARAIADAGACSGARAAVAARAWGQSDEAALWEGLAAQLRTLLRRKLVPAVGEGEGAATRSANSPTPSSLWDEERAAEQVRERVAWRERLPRSALDASADARETHVLSLVSLGELQTAVGWLLAAPPQASTGYYRDALCTLALAFASQAEEPGDACDGPPRPPSDALVRSPFVQAVKIITANAASFGDALLGVPLLACVGQHRAAVGLLQDGGYWVEAAALARASLSPDLWTPAFRRWAAHVIKDRGGFWEGARLFAAGAGLDLLAQELQREGRLDAVHCLLRLCREQGAKLEL